MTGILDPQVFDPAKRGLLARLASPDSHGLLSRLPPVPARDVVQLAWRGLQALAPNLTNPATYAPLPPPAWTPTPEGKLPSSDRDPRLEGALSDFVNIAMLLGPQWEAGLAARAARLFPAIARRGVPTAESLAAKSPTIYNPAPKPLRPFEADYPHGAPADASGRLTHDIEGRPLTAKYIVGRRAAGAEDQAFAPAEFDDLARATTGHAAATIPPDQTAFGRTTLLPLDSGRLIPTGIELRAGMRPDKADMVYAHELGHVIDEIAGQIPTRGLSDELKSVYNSLNNPNRTRAGLDAAPTATPMTPQRHGYDKEEVPREYMVEAIRAYMADPNYLKTVAPKTAAVIRAKVNAHPTLSKIIQFNAVGGLAAMNGLDSDPLVIPKQP
jgi:hypothetical protein